MSTKKSALAMLLAGAMTLSLAACGGGNTTESKAPVESTPAAESAAPSTDGAKVGQTVRVICDGIDDESGLYLCRTTGDAPEVDGNVCVSSEEPLYPGQFYDVLVEDSDLYDLYGTVAK